MKKKEVKPWAPGKEIFFGTAEGDFNAKIKDQMNLLPRAAVDKIAGSKFKSGVADIVGAFENVPVALENKFVKGFASKLDDTIVIDKSDYRPGQIEYLEKMRAATDPTNSIVGSFYGVLARPRFLVYVSADFILDGSGLAADVFKHAHMITEAIGHPFHAYSSTSISHMTSFASFPVFIHAIKGIY